jgi:hypothetical protein
MQLGIVVINSANKYGVNGEIVDVYDGPTPNNAISARVGRFMARFPSRVSQQPVTSSEQTMHNLLQPFLFCRNITTQCKHITNAFENIYHPFQLLSPTCRSSGTFPVSLAPCDVSLSIPARCSKSKLMIVLTAGQYWTVTSKATT